MKNVIICVALFLAGMWIGTLKKPETIVVTKQVEYLDFTAPDLRHRLEVYANALGMTFEDKSEINRIYDDRKDEVEKLRHQIWQAGYKDGYREGRK